MVSRRCINEQMRKERTSTRGGALPELHLDSQWYLNPFSYLDGHLEGLFDFVYFHCLKEPHLRTATVVYDGVKTAYAPGVYQKREPKKAVYATE
ncbi:unnamed protein product [Caenorhabditis nigoni]|uniref:Uncharacterized protein n=1 Tax=Caenorhabditis nigoni TaxID=1611254 RepID=A0A2G5SF54_9PELO|nr:hypothetical protein B9Z55_027548 [Caenorhabditis nigoni]